MKLLAFGLLMSIQCFGIYTVRVEANHNNIPPSYSTAGGSLLISEMPSVGNMIIINATTVPLALSVDTRNVTLPTNNVPSNPKQIVVPQMVSNVPSVVTLRDFKVQRGAKLFLRNLDGSTVSSGTVTVSVW